MSAFNSITVDGDTSTNELLCADRHRKLPGSLSTSISKTFSIALRDLFCELAQAIIRDAEGATKFIEIRVEGADSPGRCSQHCLHHSRVPVGQDSAVCIGSELGSIHHGHRQGARRQN